MYQSTQVARQKKQTNTYVLQEKSKLQSVQDEGVQHPEDTSLFRSLEGKVRLNFYKRLEQEFS